MPKKSQICMFLPSLSKQSILCIIFQDQILVFRYVYLLDRVHFWIGEQQPGFSQILCSPGTPCQIWDVNPLTILSHGHLNFSWKRFLWIMWNTVTTWHHSRKAILPSVFHENFRPNLMIIYISTLPTLIIFICGLFNWVGSVERYGIIRVGSSLGRQKAVCTNKKTNVPISFLGTIYVLIPQVREFWNQCTYWCGARISRYSII